MSAGVDNMKHTVEVAAEPAPMPPTLHKLDQAQFFEEMQVSLDCPD